MTDLTRWHQQNETYLANALAWLRQRLSDRLSPDPDSNETPCATPSPLHWAGSSDNLPPPALELLRQRLGLSPFERDLLFLCAAIELDTRMAGLCAQVQDNLHTPYPTFALAFSLFDHPAWEVLSPERPLRYWRLLDINQPGAQPLTTSALRIDERILNYIKGLNYLDDRLSSLLVPLAPVEPHSLAPSQQQAVEVALRQFHAMPAGTPPLIHLIGRDRLSKQMLAQSLTQQLGLNLYRLPVSLLPHAISELEDLVRLWQRESLLLPFTLYLDAHDENQISNSLEQFLARSQALLCISTRDVGPQLAQPVIVVDGDRPTAAEQEALWHHHLGTAIDGSVFAAQFNLDTVTIHHIAQAALSQSSDAQMLNQHLWQACLDHTRPQLDQLAQRLEPKATWDDLVLPDEELHLLQQITDQVRQRNLVYHQWGFHQRMNRGLGISALFAGDSGTGKTMAAEVIANDLQLHLYRIDLSSVVSKYIGETEKNLRRLFDAAEDGGAILFFDEADALFGKRSEVKDSHDRYANIEINYLLQRIEAYRGLAILATNLKSALDNAFMRRLRFVIQFPFPAAPQRQEMWQKAFPPQTPLDELDCTYLARLNLTGGNIHNIALNAAFLAATDGTPVTMPLLLSAAKTEFRKLGRPINEADFRWRSPVSVEARRIG